MLDQPAQAQRADRRARAGLAVALQIAVTSGAGIEEAATRALTTVRQVMPAHLRRRIDTPRFTPCELPGGDVGAFVAHRFRGTDESGRPRCRGEVILDLPASEVAPYLHDGLIEEVGPDRCRLVLGAWSWAGLAATIGRLDADVEVVGPEELRDAFALFPRRFAAVGGEPG